MKDLPSLCRKKSDIIPKVSDILAQLLQIEDQTEVAGIHASLTTLFKIDAKSKNLSSLYPLYLQY